MSSGERTLLVCDEAHDANNALSDFLRIELEGQELAMAGLADDSDAARRHFASLRELRDRLRTVCPESISLDHLSMGMSRDYEIAVEEGATMVRVGSALFEGVAS